jgi:DNA-binding NarL/FixJ family response regulator
MLPNSTPASTPAAGAGRFRVYLVEDHPIVRDGLTQLINEEADLLVCGAAADAPTALRQIPEAAPDVAVVDLLLGGDDGLELVRTLKARHPRMPTLVLSMHSESLYAERALRSGARGYVTKLAPTESVLVAIRRVLAGEIYVSEATATRLVTKLVGGDAGAADAAGPGAVARLSDREFEVFRLIGRGAGPSEIARHLGVSVKTVETHREHIKKKLGLANGRELLRAAMRNSESAPPA